MFNFTIHPIDAVNMVLRDKQLEARWVQLENAARAPGRFDKAWRALLGPASLAQRIVRSMRALRPTSITRRLS